MAQKHFWDVSGDLLRGINETFLQSPNGGVELLPPSDNNIAEQSINHKRQQVLKTRTPTKGHGIFDKGKHTQETHTEIKTLVPPGHTESNKF